MDFFSIDQYRELLAVDRGPAVSIYVDIDRQDIKGKNNQLTFRNQVDRARSLLEKGYDDEECEAVDQMMQRWLDDEPFWGNLSRGVAAYFSPQMERLYRLRSRVSTQTVVSDTFHTRPMLRPMLQPRRYWVLVLDPKHTRLFEATEDTIAEVNLFGIPASQREALDLDRPQRQTRNRESSPGSPATPAFHGYGRGKDLAPRHLRKFCAMVDEGLEELLKNEDGPLILSAPPRTHALYRDVSKLDNLAERGLQESLAHITPAKIHEKSWPLAREAVEKKLDEILELWEREYGFGKGETDLRQIAQRTSMNQVRFLLIEGGRRIWGRLDRIEGTVDIDSEDEPDESSPDRADILDDLAEFVVERGGQSYVLPADRMPSQTGAAAILRGSGRAGDAGTLS